MRFNNGVASRVSCSDRTNQSAAKNRSRMSVHGSAAAAEKELQLQHCSNFAFHRTTCSSAPSSLHNDATLCSSPSASSARDERPSQRSPLPCQTRAETRFGHLSEAGGSGRGWSARLHGWMNDCLAACAIALLWTATHALALPPVASTPDQASATTTLQQQHANVSTR